MVCSLLFATRVKLALVALLVGCAGMDGGVGGGDDDGKADGQGGSYIGYIQGNSPFYWGPSTFDDFNRVSASIGMPANPVAIPTTDQLTARLQTWIDRIDAIVRKEVKDTTGEELVAPKPIVEVLPSSNTFNAWVSPTMACTGFGDPASRSYLTSTVIANGAGYDCVRPTYPDLASFRTFWARHNPACKVEADGSVDGTGCTVETDGAAGELELISTAQYVHVSTDLIAAVSERTLAVVLAHELGHYYRAHVSDAVIQHYNFWYDSEADRKKIPVPAANATDLQTQYSAIVNGPRSVQAATTGHYSARFRNFILTSIAPLLTDRTEAGFVCAGARDALGEWVGPLLQGYGMPTDAMDSYLAFESKLVTCASKLNLTGDVGATSLSYGTVLMQVMAAKLGKVTLPFQGATLANVLDALNANAVKLDTKEASLVKQVKQNRIGLYTIEEEADDIALELSARMGIAPADVLASWQEFMGAIAQAVPPEYQQQYLDENTSCAAQLASGFVDTDGQPTFVPIGDLSEPHHSDCYRLFNFWREAKLRGYTADGAYEFPSDWQQFRDEAATLSR